MTGAARGVVLKLGGELLEDADGRRDIATAIRRLASRAPLVVVHGGGREVDTDMAALGISKRAVDGLRLTDAATLDVVVGVLAGRVNTRLVAAARVAGVPAVGLTAADAGVSSVQRAEPYTAADGTIVDLGFVGQPTGADEPELLNQLCQADLVPIVASIGADSGGQLLNVNADTLAGHLAARLGAARLLIAGGTPGVLDEHDRTIPSMSLDLLHGFLVDGRASAGMVAKLIACREARRAGVDRVDIVTGKHTDDLDTTAGTMIGD
ncbi:MAG: acetylglutamate kinase [Acidobacteria bacterium]|jgi:acetylglutamate kinase|nr:acetylglutamate kinase [Acidobacteriota bacterium]MDP7339528.1 acetylglutamate kinase [Vicinamibacterales bacterium]MDP7479289.1 acetylglutamate kinase [Vicinamibacterales bacterium]HJN46214.1 acetylglutamate kinase [Vicinamibacterales bacterium]|tara:strand:+ start:1516 stop:2313 length:798 start_codon:yes stop_codon:yes gene_type:complete